MEIFIEGKIKSVARNDELHKAEWIHREQRERGCRHRVVTVRNAGELKACNLAQVNAGRQTASPHRDDK